MRRDITRSNPLWSQCEKRNSLVLYQQHKRIFMPKPMRQWLEKVSKISHVQLAKKVVNPLGGLSHVANLLTPPPTPTPSKKYTSRGHFHHAGPVKFSTPDNWSYTGVWSMSPHKEHDIVCAVLMPKQSRQWSSKSGSNARGDSIFLTIRNQQLRIWFDHAWWNCQPLMGWYESSPSKLKVNHTHCGEHNLAALITCAHACGGNNNYCMCWRSQHGSY